MHNILAMTVIQGHKNHLERFRGQLFIEKLILDDSVEKFSAFAQLRHQIHVGGVLKVLVKLDDVWVVQLLQNPNFCLKPFPILDLGPWDELDGTH